MYVVKRNLSNFYHAYDCRKLAPTNNQPTSPPETPQGLPPPPQSTVSMFDLTFGSVCGMCAGVFIKKGAKAVAFVLGGVFVLLQVNQTSFMLFI